MSESQDDPTANVDVDDATNKNDAASKVEGVTFSNPVTNRWKVGVQIKTGRSSVKGMLVTIPVPTDWPEQKVTIVEENLPPSIRDVQYRDVEQCVKQLVAKIPSIPANELVEMTVIFQVTTQQINGPTDTTMFKIPNPVPREVRDFLGVSPQISFRNAKFRAQVKEITAGKDSAWQQVQSIADWIRDNIEYREAETTDTLSTFRKKQGGAEDLVGLFVAMCRAHKVPARMVWVEGHQYAEFLLVDAAGGGHWFPCQIAGIPEFGSISEPRIILQKGDNIKVPEKSERQKFVAEFVTASGVVKPQVNFIRQLLPAN